MITGRICDRCREPMPVHCATMTRTFGPGETDEYELCTSCMKELYRWLTIAPEDILEARKTPLQRYTEELRARAGTMPLKDAVGVVPEGMVVFYPHEAYGLVSFEGGRGMTILGGETTYKAPYGFGYNRVGPKTHQDGTPYVSLSLTKAGDSATFELDGREGRVVDANQLGPREAEKKW